MTKLPSHPGKRIDALDGILRNAQSAAEGVSAGLQSIKPPDAELTAAWERRINNLLEQMARLRDSSALGEINRQSISKRAFLCRC